MNWHSQLWQINARGQLRLSHRACLDDQGAGETKRQPEMASAGQEIWRAQPSLGDPFTTT